MRGKAREANAKHSPLTLGSRICRDRRPRASRPKKSEPVAACQYIAAHGPRTDDSTAATEVSSPFAASSACSTAAVSVSLSATDSPPNTSPFQARRLPCAPIMGGGATASDPRMDSVVAAKQRRIGVECSTSTSAKPCASGPRSRSHFNNNELRRSEGTSEGGKESSGGWAAAYSTAPMPHMQLFENAQITI